MPAKIPMNKTKRLLMQYMEASIAVILDPTKSKSVSAVLRKKLLMDHIKSYRRIVSWLTDNWSRLEGCPNPNCAVCRDNKKIIHLANTLLKQEKKL